MPRIVSGRKIFSSGALWTGRSVREGNYEIGSTMNDCWTTGRDIQETRCPCREPSWRTRCCCRADKERPKWHATKTPCKSGGGKTVKKKGRKNFEIVFYPGVGTRSSSIVAPMSRTFVKLAPQRLGFPRAELGLSEMNQRNNNINIKNRELLKKSQHSIIGDTTTRKTVLVEMGI